MRIRARANDEGGTILVLSALSIVVLMIFAALTVDLGAAWAERRQLQSAADAGAMAGALGYLAEIPPQEEDTVNVVRDYVERNIGLPANDPSWLGQVANPLNPCVDPDRPSGFDPLVDSNGHEIECISLKQADEAPAFLRVRLPDQAVPTTFARIIGINEINVSAFAEAAIEYRESFAILPFSLPATPTAEECLGTPPAGLLPGEETPCDGPNQGNFGPIDSPWFGAGAPWGTEPDACLEGSEFDRRTELHMAIGLDHLITTWPFEDPDADPPTLGRQPEPVIGVDYPQGDFATDRCMNAEGATPPYILNVRPGNSVTGGNPSMLHEGLIGDGPYGTIDAHGRLRQTTGATLEFTQTQGNWSADIDNVGLWDYIDTTLGQCNGVPGGLAGRPLTVAMAGCIEAAHTTPGANKVTFTLDLVSSPRFALVPVLNYEDADLAGNGWWAVLELRPVYLQSTWYGCTNPASDCLFQPLNYGVNEYTAIFNPGEGTTSPCRFGSPPGSPCSKPRTIQLEGLSVFVLEWDWLHTGSKNALGLSSPFEVYLSR